MNETNRPMVVPQLNLMKAVKQQEKQVLAREIIERDKLAKGLATLQQKRAGAANSKQGGENRNNLQSLKTVGDEGIGDARVNTGKNQTKPNNGGKNVFCNFRQSDAGPVDAQRVEDNDGQDPTHQQDALSKHLQQLAQLGSELNKLATDQKSQKVHFEKMKMIFSQKKLGLATHSAYQKKRDVRNVSNGGGMSSLMGGLVAGSHRGRKRKGSYHKDEDFDSSDNDESSELFDPYNNKKDLNKKSRYAARNINNNETPSSHQNQGYIPNKSSSCGNMLVTTEQQGAQTTTNFYKNSKKNIKGKKSHDQSEEDKKAMRNTCNNFEERGASSINQEIVVQAQLKQQCMGDLGIMDPMKAFQFLNIIQKAECPEAYEPEIVTQQKRKEAMLKEQEEMKKQQEEEKMKIDKTLFDFDDDVDQLSQVSERYKVQFIDLHEDSAQKRNFGQAGGKPVTAPSKSSRRVRSKDMNKQKLIMMPKRNIKPMATLNGQSSSFQKRGEEDIKAEIIKDLKESSTDTGTQQPGIMDRRAMPGTASDKNRPTFSNITQQQSVTSKHAPKPALPKFIMSDYQDFSASVKTSAMNFLNNTSNPKYLNQRLDLNEIHQNYYDGSHPRVLKPSTSLLTKTNQQSMPNIVMQSPMSNIVGVQSLHRPSFKNTMRNSQAMTNKQDKVNTPSNFQNRQPQIGTLISQVLKSSQQLDEQNNSAAVPPQSQQRVINEQLQNRITSKIRNKQNWFVWSKGTYFRLQPPSHPGQDKEQVDGQAPYQSSEKLVMNQTLNMMINRPQTTSNYKSMIGGNYPIMSKNHSNNDQVVLLGPDKTATTRLTKQQQNNSNFTQQLSQTRYIQTSTNNAQYQNNFVQIRRESFLQQDNNSNNETPLFEKIERKEGGHPFIPQVLAPKPKSGHMHIDRMQRFFCANIEKQTNELQQQQLNKSANTSKIGRNQTVNESQVNRIWQNGTIYSSQNVQQNSKVSKVGGGIMPMEANNLQEQLLMLIAPDQNLMISSPGSAIQGTTPKNQKKHNSYI